MTDEDPIEALHIAEGWLEAGRYDKAEDALHIAEGWLEAGRYDKAEDAILAALSRVRKQKARTHEGEV